jgi:hypothetical protein
VSGLTGYTQDSCGTSDPYVKFFLGPKAGIANGQRECRHMLKSHLAFIYERKRINFKKDKVKSPMQ